MQHQVAPSVRVFHDGSSAWIVRDLKRRRSWRVDRLTAATVIAFMTPQTQTDVIESLAPAKQDIVSPAEVELRIRNLKDLSIVAEADTDEVELAHLARWVEKGWGEPFDYLRATWDYPFEDYSRNGQEIDRKRMIAYAAKEPDQERFLPLKGTPAAFLPAIDEALDYFSAERVIDEGSLRTHLLHTAAAAALPTFWKESRTPGADYMKRTSPSGGGRHPSELYLIALDVPGLLGGVYHVSVGEQRLGLVGDLGQVDALRQNLPGAFRLAAPPRAIFVVSTVFARNMYRYREPRTLRTVYYDAGHIGGLVERLCDRSGVVAHGHHGFSDSYLANLIASTSLAGESPSYLVSVGLESEVAEGTVMVGR